MEKSLSLVKLARYEEARRRRGVFLIMMGIIPGREVSEEDFAEMANGPDTDHIREQIAALSEPKKELVELLRFAMEKEP